MKAHPSVQQGLYTTIANRIPTEMQLQGVQ